MPEGGIEVGSQDLELAPRRDLREAADADADRMDGPPAEDRHDAIAGLLEGQTPLDGRPVENGELDGIGAPEEVGRVQQVEVQGVTLDPLAAVEQAPERSHRGLDLDPGEMLERVDGGHLVGDGTDPADARDDVEHLVRGPADDELLEVPRRLEDRQLRLGDTPVANDQSQRPLAFDAGQPGHLEPALTGRRTRPVHQPSSLPGLAIGGPPSASMTSRNGRAYAVKPEKSRAVSASALPSRPNQRARLGAFALSRGPKQP